MPAARTAPDDQAEAIAFLSNPASYGLSACRVQQVETHCSIVFLAGDRAYKLKRALRYAALDYTTLDLRRAACAAELRLNRRTAPQLYLDVLTITRQPNGGVAFGSSGQPLDCVVMMRRFCQGELFDRLADTGRLSVPLMRELGATVARFHLAAEITPGFGGSAALRQAIAANDRELAKVATDLDGAAVSALSRRSKQALDTLAPLLDRRAQQGRVRRCHGDLRLANICLYQGQPTLFDCIEFSDAVGCIDVLHDFAFLLMDLHLRGRPELGNAVFNAYLDVATETDGLRTLPLFLALRAATRSFALAGSAQRRQTAREARRLRDLARRHIGAGLAFLAPPAPRLVVLGGGTGPQRLDCAARVAATIPPAPGGRVLSLDPCTSLLAEARAVLAAGCPVVLAGAFRDPAQSAAVAAIAAELCVATDAFWFGETLPASDRLPWQVSDPDDAFARCQPPV